MSPATRWRTAAAAGALGLALSGCGSSARHPVALATTPRATPTSATPMARPPVHRPAATHRPAPRRTPTPSTAPQPTAAPTAAPQPPLLIYRLHGVGDAQQVVSATSDTYATTMATLQLWQKEPGGRWASVGGPWPANIGYNGFSSDKREGDGTTPVGSYGFGIGFGVQANPGYRDGWIHVDQYDVWVDDPASAYYNTHQRDPADGRWQHAEAMDQPGVYDYAAVIDYNMNPVRPGAGSAIFLHVSPGGPTAGCVALPLSDLLTTLRWLNPAEAPRIIMGPVSAVT